MGIVLITGASGKTGRAVIAALARAGVAARALVRQTSQAEELIRLGALEAATADMRSASEVRSAMRHVRAVYHICPNVHPHEVEIGRIVLDGAREMGVEHIVLHSVLHPQAVRMPHHGNKLRVEEALLESGLDFTILQPAAYMQNLLAGWRLITEAGLLRLPYPADTQLSLVDLEDVAEAAAIALTDRAHLGAIYELAGTPPLSQTEVAAILSSGLGRPVRAESESIEAWDARARDAGLGETSRTTLIQMFHHYREFGLIGNPNVLRWLLGREPTPLIEFTRRAAAGALS